MKRLVLVGAVALAAHVTACGDAPVAPQAVPRFTSTSGEAASAVAKYKNGRRVGQSFAMASIGPAGGLVALGGFEIVVPAGALLETTSITITLPTDQDKSGYVLAEFGPHGIRFQSPVIIRLPQAGTTAEGSTAARVLWFNGFDWVALPSMTTPDGRVQAETDHFSEYGTEDPSRGITLAGG